MMGSEKEWDEMKVYKRKWKEMFQRQLMFIANANPSTPQEIYSQLLRQGFGRTIAIRIVNSYISTLIIYPIAVGVKNYFASFIGSGINYLRGKEQEEAKTLTEYVTEAFPSAAGRYWGFLPFTTYIPEFIQFIRNSWNNINEAPIILADILRISGGHKDDVEKAKEAIKNISDKIENTPLGFEMFVKKKGLTVKTPYDGISGQTNEPDPNGAKTNNWYFNTNTNTFESY
jgi:hypothetical protein